MAASSSTVNRYTYSPQEGPKQGDAVVLRGVGHLQLHRQPAQPGPDGQLGQEEDLLMGGLLVQDLLEQPLLRREALSLGVQPLHVPKAQAGPGEAGRQNALRRPLLRPLTVQRDKDAPLSASGHQVLHLKALARPRAAGEADHPLPRLAVQQVQPPGRLLPCDQRPGGPLLLPVKEPQPRHGGHRPGAEELPHHRVQDQLSLQQPLPVKEAGKPVPPGKPGQILLHGGLQGQETAGPPGQWWAPSG